MRGDTQRLLRCCDEVQKIVDEAALGDFAQHVLVDNWRGRTHTRMGDYQTGYRLTKLATDRWREAEGADVKLHAILDGVRELAVLATDADWDVISFNGGASALLGWEKEALQGEPVSRLFEEQSWSENGNGEASASTTDRFGSPMPARSSRASLMFLMPT